LVVAVLTALLTVVLWKPFKRLQEQRDDSPVTSDLVGFTFVLAEAVEPDGCVMYKYSGIEWRLVSDTPIASGTKVRVVEVEVGQWHVEPF
jgi:membrane protein implicated in regulation of membrane protease activity